MASTEQLNSAKKGFLQDLKEVFANKWHIPPEAQQQKHAPSAVEQCAHFFAGHHIGARAVKRRGLQPFKEAPDYIIELLGLKPTKADRKMLRQCFWQVVIISRPAPGQTPASSLSA